MSDQPETPALAQIKIIIKTLTGRTTPLTVSPTDTVLRVKELIVDGTNRPARLQRLVFAGKTLADDDATLASVGIVDGSTVHVVQAMRKPVIYLFAPSGTTLRAAVCVKLAPQWAFSCVYPVVEVKRDSAGRSGTVEWDVEVRQDCLVDLATGNEEAYLFWEAQSNPQLLDSPAPSRPNSPTPATFSAFNPAHPLLTPSNSVLLNINQVPAYLQTALKALALHVEARTSFITYWLPDMQKHQHIALRFLPQHEYAQAAELSVTPAPEVVTRVFMLFRGIGDDDSGAQLQEWRAKSMSAHDPTCWKDIVGVSGDAGDKTLLRVLEWGGMEV